MPAAGLNIDLGARRLVLTKTLTISGPASAGLFINAGNVLIDGGTIVAPGALDVAGGITIISDTDMTVKNNGLIDVSAGVSGGEVDLEATAGNLSFDGRIKANGTTRAGDGGDVNLFAGGTLTVDRRDDRRLLRRHGLRRHHLAAVAERLDERHRPAERVGRRRRRDRRHGRHHAS